MPKQAHAVPEGTSDHLPEFLGAGLAIALISLAMMFDGSDAGPARGLPVRAVAPPSEVGPSGYEALREALVLDPGLSPDVRVAVSDGILDVVEMERISPSAPVRLTALPLAVARRDLIDTLEATEKRR